jgi:3-hydroxybutyryl-CoA dehydrogenase
MKEIDQIAVIGAGVMGCGVSLNLALKGYPVILKDISDEVLKEAENKIRSDYRMVKMMNRSLVTESLDEVLQKITFQLTYDNFNKVDLVIENVNELVDIKIGVFKEIKNLCKPETIFAINTSCIPITKLASYFADPSKVIGLHFMNPVPLKLMVETIKGFHTSQETIDITKAFLKSMDKQSVVVNDSPGFVANRLSHLFMNEAAFVVYESIANPADVDAIFKKGYMHAMGPLETADLIGLDTVLDSLNVLYDNFKDSKFRPCPLLQKKVDAGLLGRKSGEGFYKY